jgi:putative endonuclease
MATAKEIGTAGENSAAEYLENLGYEILEKNYKSRMGEIDIIALSPEEVCVFVEVKTRKNTDFGMACEAVDKRKQEKLVKTAMTYRYGSDMRFDVIEVYYSGKTGFEVNNINHIKNAFEAAF